MFWKRQAAVVEKCFVGIVVLHRRHLDALCDSGEEVVSLADEQGDETLSAALEFACLGTNPIEVEKRIRDQFDEEFGANSVVDVLAGEVESPSQTLLAVTAPRKDETESSGPSPAVGVPILIGRSHDRRAEALKWVRQVWTSIEEPRRRGRSTSTGPVWYLEVEVRPAGEDPQADKTDPAYVGCWTRADDGEVALWVIRRALRKQGWVVTTVYDSVPVERADQSRDLDNVFDQVTQNGVVLTPIDGPRPALAWAEIKDGSESEALQSQMA